MLIDFKSWLSSREIFLEAKSSANEQLEVSIGRLIDAGVDQSELAQHLNDRLANTITIMGEEAPNIVNDLIKGKPQINLRSVVKNIPPSWQQSMNYISNIYREVPKPQGERFVSVVLMGFNGLLKKFSNFDFSEDLRNSISRWEGYFEPYLSGIQGGDNNQLIRLLKTPITEAVDPGGAVMDLKKILVVCFQIVFREGALDIINKMGEIFSKQDTLSDRDLYKLKKQIEGALGRLISVYGIGGVKSSPFGDLFGGLEGDIYTSNIFKDLVRGLMSIAGQPEEERASAVESLLSTIAKQYGINEELFKNRHRLKKDISDYILPAMVLEKS